MITEELKIHLVTTKEQVNFQVKPLIFILKEVVAYVKIA
jgi:hypothetical protein